VRSADGARVVITAHPSAHPIRKKRPHMPTLSDRLAAMREKAAMILKPEVAQVLKRRSEKPQ
jgi:hypothetical protein